MAESARRSTSLDRRKSGLRELRLRVPDARLPIVRQRVARAVAEMGRTAEADTLAWVEAVSEYDDPDIAGQ